MMPQLIQVFWRWAVKRCHEIWKNVYQHGLWRRMIKIVLATALTDAIMLIPKVEHALGKAVYLAGITTAFGHPGRRLGQMVEALVLVILGTLLGSAWSILGVYLGSLLMSSNQAAAYTVRGVFLAIALLLHGFFRSHTPRVFLGTVLFIICSVVNLSSTAKTVSPTTATQLIYPIFIAIGIVLIINLTVFPEFSSSYLGGTVTGGFQEIASSLRRAGDYFTHAEELVNSDMHHTKDSKQPIKISTVTASKATIRAKVNDCTTALRECNFELSYSTLPPRELKSTNQVVAKITGNIAAIIGACESKYALLGDDPDLVSLDSIPTTFDGSTTAMSAKQDATAGNVAPEPVLRLEEELELVKPRREIESGDPDLLRNLVKQIAPPYRALQSCIDRAVDVINAGISYTYHVPRLPSGMKTPSGIEIDEVDLYAEMMRQAVETFDKDIRSALEAANIWGEVGHGLTDLMPREEIFLISSFYLNLRQAAMHIITMLEQVRALIDQYHTRKGRRRLYAPRIAWRSWLYTGGGEEQDRPEVRNHGGGQSKRHNSAGDNEDDSDDDEVSQNLLDQKDGYDVKTPKAKRSSTRATTRPNLAPITENETAVPTTSQLRILLADSLDAVQYSSDLQYAFKVAVAALLVLWPALVSSWNHWFSLERGLWAALQLILITEPTTGNSIQSFILRAFGTTLGCLWGWAAYEIGGGNRIACGFLIAVGVIPAAYVIVGSSYIKAGIVSSVSITVVALATEVGTVPGTATENFLKRFLAFTIGAAVALVVQFSFLPVKARLKMVECLGNCLRHVQTMEHSMAFGLESTANLNFNTSIMPKRFDKASAKAKAALQAAEGYIPFVKKEPRLKGSFSGQLLVYQEIIFVIHQIVDRMDNMAALRANYGSGPLQEYNAQILQYRRNLAASIITCLFAVQEALITHLPLPQFVPSARLAHIRLINRVREVVRGDVQQPPDAEEDQSRPLGHVMRRSFLSWNATAMSMAEIIEYLEELVELAKLLVGANEFRTGLLFRPSFQDHTETAPKEDFVSFDGATAEGLQRRTTVNRDSKGSEDAEVPYSLKRIQTRKFDAVLKRKQTWENKG